jgi:hypothetical protein
VPPATYSDSGLFRGALGFEGRFSFGLIDHRSSSIFLEQVSLANFCGVIVIYLVSFANRISLFDRLIFMSTIVLILVTNDTRTMLIFTIVSAVGYVIYPWIPKIFSFLMMPAIVVVGFVIHAYKPDAHDDDFVGRISGTVRNIIDMDLAGDDGARTRQGDDLRRQRLCLYNLWRHDLRADPVLAFRLLLSGWPDAQSEDASATRCRCSCS